MEKKLGLASKIGLTLLGISFPLSPFIFGKLDDLFNPKETRLVWVSSEGDYSRSYPNHEGEKPYLVYKWDKGIRIEITPFESAPIGGGEMLIDLGGDGKVDLTRNWFVVPGRIGYINTKDSNQEDQRLYDKVMAGYEQGKIMKGMFKPDLWNPNR